MKTCLILLGLVAAFVAVDCGVIAETKRQQQVSEVNMIDSMVYITGRLETLVENLAALKQAVEDFGGHQALEEYVCKLIKPLCSIHLYCRQFQIYNSPFF
ncbi:hypothetical protein KP79_PYT10996 [Mizuhopecten yessoensis]|uniref:Uncharacterized protein n=1 Tax=Mizuhopecten yessoensis TaxID=6573 RepID=A0A210PZX7_MIZYE|nr:hypothetical protein KP79_PYT10996 [Mizuhopecten yessoensis]